MTQSPVCPPSVAPPPEQLFVWASRHFLLVNALSAKGAIDDLSDLIKAKIFDYQRCSARMGAEATRAGALLNRPGEPLSLRRYSKLKSASHSPELSQSMAISGLGSYLIEVGVALFVPSPGVLRLTHCLISAQPRGISLDVDGWSSGDAMSLSDLRAAFVAALEQADLDRSIASAASSIKRAGL